MPWVNRSWDAFAFLSSFRDISEFAGGLPIKLDAIRSYAVDHGPDDVDGFELFVAQVKALDAEWLEQQANKIRQDQQNRKRR